VSAASLLLIVLACAFAWSMGAHYTGACMGMPYATGSISLRPALITMALFVLAGASFLSHRVLLTVGHNLLDTSRLGKGAACAIIAAAFILTALYNRLKIPTSTIQILVFAIIGAGLALRIRIEWMSIVRLVVVWAIAPIAALFLGFTFTRVLDIVPGLHGQTRAVGVLLVLAGCLASLTMGANDVSNATGVFIATGLSGMLVAGALGGASLALGVLTWGRPLLQRVAFEIVKLDLPMASAAQLVQGLVVLIAVLGFGDFTSMNQALVGAMAGAGLARGRETVQWRTLRGILQGWIIGPVSGCILAYLFAIAARHFA
jgi:PiT family inorganic phosphate transporter